jgi:uncharacterized repeat protein (TIGR01451 family)
MSYQPGARKSRRTTLESLAVLAAVVMLNCAASATGMQALHGHVPAVTAGLSPVGGLADATQMKLIIALPLRDKAALTNFLDQLYNPASPMYHQYLTQDQFTARFGPTARDYQAVMDFAAANALRVTGTHPNRTLVDVTGTVADIQKAFHLRLRLYQHPVETRTFFAPDVEPSLDLGVPVLSITGLNNYVLPHPRLVRTVSRDPAKPRLGSGKDGTYLGKDFRAAYVPGASLTGAGQTVGLFELDGYDASDISSYESEAGLPGVPLANVLIDGASGGLDESDDGSEVSLDIEMAVSMAPGLTRIIVYEGPDIDNITGPNLVLTRMATDNLARQLSCSWGFSIDSATDQTFQQFAAQGQSFFLASGDSGAYTDNGNPVSLSPPADDPYVTVVGATTLSTSGPVGTWQSETVWNWFTTGEGTGAGSGGTSTSYLIPSWQAPVSMAANQGSTTYRNLPDVAMVGDNVWVIYGGGQTGDFGGTSCATPLWAAFTALVNEQGSNNLRAPVGFLNPAIYSIGLGASYGMAFHDVTLGNNTNNVTQSQYFAVPGFDLCTGWGTPMGTSLINLLVPPSTTPILTGSASLFSESCLPTNGAVDPGETVTVNLALSDFAEASTTNLVATLLPSASVLDPSGPQTYGVVKGGGPAVKQSYTFTAEGACGEVIPAVWLLQDGAANLGTVTINFALGALVSANTFSQNFDAVAAPALPAGWSNVVSGSQVDWVTSAAAFDTPPNSAFATDVAATGLVYLNAPSISVLSSNAQLTFRQNYDLEAVTTTSFFTGQTTTTYYDGGVLEIAIGAGSFADILSAGGSFVTGGYVGTLYSRSGNPLGGRAAWSGDSGGWITTTVNLPPSAAGQSIQLRWGCATDEDNIITVTGWYVDTISLKDAYYACCNDSAALSVAQAPAPSPFLVGQNGTYTLTLTNAGPDLAANVVVTDALPSGVSFVSASPGCVFTNGNIIYSAGTLAAGASDTVSITVLPDSAGSVTNSVSVASITANSNSANNPSLFVTAVLEALVPPILDPANIVINATGFSISLQSVAGQNYTLQYKNSLTDPAWTTIPASTVPGTGGNIVLQDGTAPSVRFYRVSAN